MEMVADELLGPAGLVQGPVELEWSDLTSINIQDAMYKDSGVIQLPITRAYLLILRSVLQVISKALASFLQGVD